MTATPPPAKRPFHVSALNRDGGIEDWTESFVDADAARRELAGRGYEIRWLEPVSADVWEAGRDRAVTQAERDLRVAADEAEAQKRIEDELMRRGDAGTVMNRWLTGTKFRRSDLWRRDTD